MQVKLDQISWLGQVAIGILILTQNDISNLLASNEKIIPNKII